LVDKYPTFEGHAFLNINNIRAQIVA